MDAGVNKPQKGVTHRNCKVQKFQYKNLHNSLQKCDDRQPRRVPFADNEAAKNCNL